MKKIFNTMLLLAATLLFSACTYEVDDTFDQSSAERIAAALKKNKQVLTSAENGWIMEYYAATGFGGYNVYVKFTEDDQVTVQNELFDAEESATSHYKLEQSEGVILSFDEYNKYFHYFSDPNGNVSGLGPYYDGTGMNGDLEFRMVSVTDDRIEMTGKKHGSKIVLTKVGEDFDWAAYKAQVEAVEESYSFSQYGFVVDDEMFRAEVSYRCFYVTINAGTEEEQEIGVPYIVKPEGLQFYRTLTLNGKDITGVTFVEDYDRSDIEWPAFNDASIVMVPVTPPLNQQFIEGRWWFTYSRLGEFAQPYWLQVQQILANEKSEDSQGEELYYAYVGQDTGGRFGLGFASRGKQTNKTFGGTICFDYTLEDEDIVTMWHNGKFAEDGKIYYNTVGIKPIAVPFGTGTADKRTFKLETDNSNRPSYITLVDQNDPTNVITVLRAVTTDPFDN